MADAVPVPSKPIMFAMHPYPPVGGGSTVIMKNLLGALPPEKVVVATIRKPGQEETDPDSPYPVYRLMRDYTDTSSRGGMLAMYLQIGRTARIVARLVKQHRCGAVVGVYPNVFYLAVARRAAKLARVPFVPYLHDTVAEALTGRPFGKFAARFQKKLLKDLGPFFVMSQGMADLYQHKYNLSPTPLVHSYPETVPVEPPSEPTNSKGFWSGHIYEINMKAMGRVYRVMRETDTELVIASGQNHDAVKNMGFADGGIHFTLYRERPALLEALRQQSFLILALDWPDETHIHPDEMSTIFPTKTIEYLAAGRPILLHCPEHYFLARWCREHDCAEIVTERSEEALRAALERIAGDTELMKQRCLNGYKAAAPFTRERVATTFVDGMESIWRQT
ncbi:MAG: hypothetical protein QNK37_16805 [Acidobacteriota bacterium]|nr:hypothetical protein [Acidobacteriota bacterium]